MRLSLLAKVPVVRRRQAELVICAGSVIPRVVQRFWNACESVGACPPTGVVVHFSGWLRQSNGSDAKLDALPGFGLLITMVVPWPQMRVQKAVLLPGSTQ